MLADGWRPHEAFDLHQSDEQETDHGDTQYVYDSVMEYYAPSGFCQWRSDNFPPGFDNPSPNNYNVPWDHLSTKWRRATDADHWKKDEEGNWLRTIWA